MRLPKLVTAAVLCALALVAVLVAFLGWPAGSGPTTPVEDRSAGTLVVVNQRDATATLIDLDTGKARATARIDLCSEDRCPQEVAVSPGGRTAAVANYGLPLGPRPGNTIVLIDVATGGTPRTLILGKFTAPCGLQWLDEDRLLCTSETTRALIEIDTKRARIVRALKTGQAGSHLLAVSADRTRAYAANAGPGTVSVFDFARGVKVRDVPVGKEPAGLALSPDGRRLWVASRGERTVQVLDTEDLRVVTTLPAPGTPHRIAFTPDGRTVAVTEPDGAELALYDAATAVQVKRIAFGKDGGPLALAFSPDGKTAYCTLSAGNAVAVVDVERGAVVNRFATGAGPYGIAFSPVGGRK
jgi:YVTN family beta-propeller protein